MMHYYDYGGYGWEGLGFFFQLAFWALIIWLIVSLIRHTRPHHHDETPQLSEKPRPTEIRETKDMSNDPAMIILRERFARGDISKEEFEEKKRLLAS